MITCSFIFITGIANDMSTTFKNSKSIREFLCKSQIIQSFKCMSFFHTDKACQFMNLLARFYLFSEALVRRTKDTVIEKGQK